MYETFVNQIRNYQDQKAKQKSAQAEYDLRKYDIDSKKERDQLMLQQITQSQNQYLENMRDIMHNKDVNYLKEREMYDRKITEMIEAIKNRAENQGYFMPYDKLIELAQLMIGSKKSKSKQRPESTFSVDEYIDEDYQLPYREYQNPQVIPLPYKDDNPDGNRIKISTKSQNNQPLPLFPPQQENEDEEDPFLPALSEMPSQQNQDILVEDDPEGTELLKVPNEVQDDENNADDEEDPGQIEDLPDVLDNNTTMEDLKKETRTWTRPRLVKIYNDYLDRRGDNPDVVINYPKLKWDGKNVYPRININVIKSRIYEMAEKLGVYDLYKPYVHIERDYNIPINQTKAEVNPPAQVIDTPATGPGSSQAEIKPTIALPQPVKTSAEETFMENLYQVNDIDTLKDIYKGITGKNVPKKINTKMEVEGAIVRKLSNNNNIDYTDLNRLFFGINTPAVINNPNTPLDPKTPAKIELLQALGETNMPIKQQGTPMTPPSASYTNDDLKILIENSKQTTEQISELTKLMKNMKAQSFAGPSMYQPSSSSSSSSQPDEPIKQVKRTQVAMAGPSAGVIEELSRSLTMTPSQLKELKKKEKELKASIPPPPPPPPMEDVNPKDSEQQASGFKPDGEGLFNYEIDEMMKPYKSFIGTFAVDQLDKIKPPQNFAIIINTEPIKTKSGHWVALFVGDGNVEYYDPFGEEPDKRMKKSILNMLSKIGAHNYQFKINRIKNQNKKTSTCGYHTMLFLKNRFEGKTFMQATGFDKLQKSIENSDIGEEAVKKFKNSIKKFGHIHVN